MKNKILKIFMCSFILICITGCSINADITITENKKVKEDIDISILNSDIISQGYSVDEYLDMYTSNPSNTTLYKDYSIKSKKSKNYSHIIIKKDYKELNEYIDSYTFKTLFDGAVIEDTGKYLTFHTTSNRYSNYNPDEGSGDYIATSNYTVSIKFYNEVLDNNADKIDKSNNTYTWYFSDADSSDSYIYFKLGPKVKYFVKFKDYIMNNILSIIVVASIIGIIAISILYIVYKSKKNNEI